MTLVYLVALSQLADALGYSLAAQRGLTNFEVNPIAAAIGDPTTLLLLKIAAGLVLGLGSIVLIRGGRQRWVAWISVIGFVGALSEVSVL